MNISEEQKKALVSELGEERASELLGIKEANESASKGTDVTIDLTDSVLEKINEVVEKNLEAEKKAAKKFRFTGSDADKARYEAAKAKREGNEYFKHIAYGNYEAAANLDSVKARAKALTEGATATAGVLVPEIFETEIFANFDDFSVVAGDARRLDTSQPGDVINLNQLDAKVSVYELAELGASTASTPSYSAPAIEYTKYGIEVVLSEEFLEDTEADIMSNISQQAAEQFDFTIQDRLVNRATSDQEGILQVSGVTVVTMGNGGSYLQATFGDLRSMKTTLSAEYNKREATQGRFYLHDLTWEAILDNVTTSGSGFSQYAVNPFEGTPARAHGQDVRVVNEIATPTITGTKFAFYSDLSKHLVVSRKRGMRMKLNTTGTASDGTNLNTQDARQIVANLRMGHSVVLPSGIVVLVS